MFSTFICFMRILLLSILIVISVGSHGQMEPGLLSIECFGSTRYSRFNTIPPSSGYFMKREQYGLMFNGWFNKHIFLGIGTGQMNVLKTITQPNLITETYEGQTYRVHVGYAATGAPGVKFFAGGKLRYTYSDIDLREFRTIKTIDAKYWSAGFVAFLGYRPCHYFMIVTEPFGYEFYRIGPYWEGKTSTEYGGLLPRFTFNLQLHFCYPLLGKRQNTDMSNPIQE